MNRSIFKLENKIKHFLSPLYICIYILFLALLKIVFTHYTLKNI